MESPSKIDRRQAWARSGRRKFTVRENRSFAGDDPHFSFQDDVFTDGCSAGKIQTWLQGCGNEASPSKNSHLTTGPLRTGTSFEDDLSLGAEATALYTRSDGPQFSTPKQKLGLPLFNMGQSVASSGLSGATSRTASSVSEVLQMRAEDAEDTLYQLGFGCEEPQVTARIPVRFFNFPSQLRGINFRLFLESQLTRIHQEDPCLSLASRFRQVEALTAMANAFYSLYSHVSRTPLQKLAPPQLTFTSPVVERTVSRTSIRSEPRSPVERLKDTISKMCLYTSSRGSESASPSGSPRKRKCSLSGVVEKTQETTYPDDANEQGANLDLQMELDDLEPDMDWYTEVKKDLEETCDARNAEGPTEPVPLLILEDSRETDNVHSLRNTEAEFTSRSGTEVESKGSAPPSVHLKSSSVTMEPVPVITHDVICPQVIECVNKAPYRCPKTNTGDAKDSQFAQPSIRQSNTITPLSNEAGAVDDALSENWTSDFSSQPSDTSQTSLCQITITGWEGDAPLPNRETQEQCSSNIQSYLSPVKPPNLIHLRQCPKQGNSFEMEEVHSAEEEEVTSSELSPTATLSVSTRHQKSSPLRGDSFQSDSSGYAEEDTPHSLSKPSSSVTSVK